MKEFIEATQDLSFKLRSELSVNNLGYEQCAPGYQYGPRVCSYHLIHFVTEGEGELHILGKHFQIRKNDAFLIPSGQIAYYRSSSLHPWTYAWVGFLGYRANEYFDRLMDHTEERYILRNLDAEKYSGLISRAAQIKENNIANYFRANSTLQLILGELFEEIDELSHHKDEIKIADEIRYYLEVKYSEKIQIKELARDLSIHPNYLTRIFRNKFGITPKKYLTGLKLEKACSLLQTTDYPVSVIADALGFEDQMSFAKIFRAHYGMTPTQYRNNSLS